MNLISFICVNYNNHNVTAALIRSLESQYELGNEYKIQCIVVDNSSCEDEIEFLNSIKCDNLDLLICNPGKNLGYFQGLNFGLNFMRGQFAVICNNDLKFDRAFCRTLINLKFERNIFAIAPSVVTEDGYFQNPHVLRPFSRLRRLQMDLYFSNYYIARFLISLLSILRPKRRVLPVLNAGCEIHMGIGACYILTANFFKNFNKLNYSNFLYGEEAYFSKQIHDAGGILWYEPILKVTHAESLSTTKLPKRQTYEYAKEGYPEYRKYL